MPRWETPEADVIKARDLVDEGFRPGAVAQQLGYTSTTIRVWTDPEYASRRASQINSNRGERKSRAKLRRMPSMPRVPL